MGVLQLLAQDSFITYNKIVAKKIGVSPAILLGALCSYQNSFNNEEFFKEQDKISEDTCLSIYEIQQALKILVKNEIVSVNKKGLPAKNYYFVVDDKLSKFLTTGDLNFESHNNNTNTNNTRKENIAKESYSNCTNESNDIIPIGKANNQPHSTDSAKIKEIIAYLNDKVGTRYSATSKKSNTHIKARLNEGYSVEDFKLVIDQKHKDWYNTEYSEYLRPETLFGNKFEGYLNKAIMNKPKAQAGAKVDKNGVISL